MRVLALFCLLAAASFAEGIIVAHKSVDPDANVVFRLCKNKPASDKTTYCWPRSYTQYVKCSGNGKGKLYNCPKGTRYDYVNRRCMDEKKAKPCRNLYCPDSLPGVQVANFSEAPLSSYGQFGTVGNATLSFPRSGRYRVVCPVYGHCLSGMSFDVIVQNVTNPTPQTVDIGTYNEYTEILQGPDRYYRHLKTITLKKGDKLFVDWDEPIHFVAVYDMTTSKRVPVAPYPPQPTYACPNWTVAFDGKGLSIPLVPGEVRLVDFNETSVGENYTWTATKPETLWFACSLPNHCRLGQVFKTEVKPAVKGYKPRTYKIAWLLTDYENYPDMTVKVGDKINFGWTFPQPVHMLSILKNMTKY